MNDNDTPLHSRKVWREGAGGVGWRGVWMQRGREAAYIFCMASILKTKYVNQKKYKKI